MKVKHNVVQLLSRYETTVLRFMLQIMKTVLILKEGLV